MPIDLEAQLASPTPLASTVWSLALLAVLGALYLLFKLVRGKRPPTKAKDTAWDKIIGAVRAFDGALITYGTYVTGTRYDRRWVRLLILITYFTTLAIIAAFAPWPWGLLPIVLGVLSIFVVFRHWTVDEDERFDEVPFDAKKIPIRGDLNLEVVIACAFLFVYAPSAFAQLQANGYGFQMAPSAGPFAFIIYTLLEAVKAGSLIDYYDLFAERLGFETYAGARNPTPWAKWAVIAYRLSLNLLLLAALKRLLDIARRMAEGRDLRHVEEMLLNPDEPQQVAAVELLEDFALLRGRGAARALLERILQPGKADAWKVGPAVRFEAAGVLQRYADRQGGGTGSLYAAIAGYKRILTDDWSRSKEPERWAKCQYALGNTLRELAEIEGNALWHKDAISAYRAAQEVCTRETAPNEWARLMNSIGVELRNLGDLEESVTRIGEAIATYHEVLDAIDRQKNLELWADLQHNIGMALSSRGKLENNQKFFEEALPYFRAAFDACSADADVKSGVWTWGLEGYPTYINSLAIALARIAHHKMSQDDYKEAIYFFRDVLLDCAYDREDEPFDWAMAQHNLANALSSLGDIRNDATLQREALAAYEKALSVYTREARPLDWAEVKNGIGNCLTRLERDSEAISAYRDALEVCKAMRNWSQFIMTQINLGDAFRTLGEIKRDPDLIEEAIAVYCEALEISRREAMPQNEDAIKNSWAGALQLSGEYRRNPEPIEKAITIYREVLDARPREVSPADWADSASDLAEALDRLGSMTKSAIYIEEAIRKHRDVLEVRTLESSPTKWAETQMYLGKAFRDLGQLERNESHLEEAVKANRRALDVYDREEQANAWARTSDGLANALQCLGELRQDVALLAESRKAALAALELRPQDENVKHTLKQIDEAILAMSTGSR